MHFFYFLLSFLPKASNHIKLWKHTRSVILKAYYKMTNMTKLKFEYKIK